MPTDTSRLLMVGVRSAGKSGVETAKTCAKRTESVGRTPRFQSSLTEHVTAILRLRYVDRKSVKQVLLWLLEQKCAISHRNYHAFMGRVLRLMTLELGKKLGVDVDLLRAVRVRLKYTVDPRRPTALGSKRVKRFYSRSRRRRLQTVPKAKRGLPPARTPRRERVSDPGQLLRAGIVPTPVQPGMDQVKGDMTDFRSLSRNDWKIINHQARAKLRVLDRKVFTNYQGRVFHLNTRADYTRETLIRGFGLTPAEAESCYLTL